MRCVVQRVSQASVSVQGKVVGEIGLGILAFVGIGQEDEFSDIKWLARKMIGLRIFEDTEGKMNQSLTDINGKLLLVSQFTLFGDCRKGKRPSFSEAAPPEVAKAIFDQLVDDIRQQGITVETGQFQAHMDVFLINNGPVTILLDSKREF